MPAVTTIDRLAFFKRVRQAPFGGRLTIGQVEGLNHLLDTWEKTQAGQDLRWLAYALATVFHETGATMQPIREIGSPDYFFRMYDPLSPEPRRAALAKRMGAKPGEGGLFYGRSYPQITWRVNYLFWEKRLGIDLTSTAEARDRVMDPDIGARILFEGMIEGVFTGKKLADYFGPQRGDWRGARRIINGLDKADLVAGYGREFHAALMG